MVRVLVGGLDRRFIILRNAHVKNLDTARNLDYLNSAYVPGWGFYNGKYDADKRWNIDLDLNNHALLLEAAAFAVTSTPLTQSL
jgi:hypothetical protein